MKKNNSKWRWPLERVFHWLKIKIEQLQLDNMNSKLAFVAQIFALVMLAVVPLLPGTNGVYYNITVSKYVYFVVATSLFLVAEAYVLFGLGKGVKKSFKLSTPQWVILAFMAWSFISACVATSFSWHDKLIGQSRYEALLSILLYGVIFLLLSLFIEHSNVYLYGLATMSIILGLIATMQCFGSKILYPGDYSYFSISFLGTLGNIDCYSGVVSMLIPALVGCYVFMDADCGFGRGGKKLFNHFFMLLGIFLLFYAQLRCDVDSGKMGLLAAFLFGVVFFFDTKAHIARTLQALGVMALSFALYGLLGKTNANGLVVTAGKKFVVGLLGAVILFGVGMLLEKGKLKLLNKLPDQKKMQKILLIAVLVIIVAGLVFVYTYDYEAEGAIKLLAQASQLMHGQLTDRMGTLRGYIWKATFKIIGEHPIAGVGPGCFKTAFEPYNAGYQVYQPGTVVDFAHNDYLQIAACEGLVGLAIYLAFVVILLVRGIKSRLAGDPLSPIYLLGCVGFFAHTLFGFSIAIVSPTFWVLAGLLEAQNRKVIQDKTE